MKENGSRPAESTCLQERRESNCNGKRQGRKSFDSSVDYVSRKVFLSGIQDINCDCVMDESYKALKW